MKRSGLALMVLMMLIGLLPVIATEPADATMENRELFGSILSDSDDRIRSLTVVDGTAYFLTQAF